LPPYILVSPIFGQVYASGRCQSKMWAGLDFWGFPAISGVFLYMLAFISDRIHLGALNWKTTINTPKRASSFPVVYVSMFTFSK